MSEPNDLGQLDPKYDQMAILVAGGASVRDAAEQCGVGESNGYRESRKPAFKAKVSSLRQHATDEALGLLVSNLKVVLENILKLATTGSERTQLDACKILLANHTALANVAEFRDRLERLEEQMKGKQ